MQHQVIVQGSAEQFPCSEDENLLQGMQSRCVGTPMLNSIPVGCRGGGCGICRIRVLEGEYEAKKMSRKHIPERDQLQGIVLACRIYPRSKLIISVMPQQA